MADLLRKELYDSLEWFIQRMVVLKEELLSYVPDEEKIRGRVDDQKQYNGVQKRLDTLIRVQAEITEKFTIANGHIHGKIKKLFVGFLEQHGEMTIYVDNKKEKKSEKEKKESERIRRKRGENERKLKEEAERIAAKLSKTSQPKKSTLRPYKSGLVGVD